jgi:hypothetical protein
MSPTGACCGWIMPHAPAPGDPCLRTLRGSRTHLAARFVPVAAARVRASKCNDPGTTSAAHRLPRPPSLSSGRARAKPWGSAPTRPTYSESGSCGDGGACPERSRRAPFVSRPQLRSARSSWDGLARFAQPSQPTHLPQLRSVSPRQHPAKMMDTIATWN